MPAEQLAEATDFGPFSVRVNVKYRNAGGTVTQCDIELADVKEVRREGDVILLITGRNIYYIDFPKKSLESREIAINRTMTMLNLKLGIQYRYKAKQIDLLEYKLGDIPPPPVVELSNDIRVANFASPHPFRFVDGSYLPECDPLRVRALTVQARETEHQSFWPDIKDVSIEMVVPDAVLAELEKINLSAEIDFAIISMHTLLALKQNGIELGKARGIRNLGRNKKVSLIDKFVI